MGNFESAANAARSEFRNALVCSRVKLIRSFRSAPLQNAIVGLVEARMSPREEDAGVFARVVISVCRRCTISVERAFRVAREFSRRMSIWPGPVGAGRVT